MTALGDWGWTGDAAAMDWEYAQRPGDHNYSIAYARARQLGVPHELAVQSAQRQVYNEVRSQNPEPENARNRSFGVKPLYSTLPALAAQQAAVAELEQAPVPVAPSGRRIAMRYGLPALAALGGLYALSALSQPRSEVEQESYVQANTPGRDPRDYRYSDGTWRSETLPQGVSIDQAIKDGTWS
jgi:hypothetical protein